MYPSRSALALFPGLIFPRTPEAPHLFMSWSHLVPTFSQDPHLSFLDYTVLFLASILLHMFFLLCDRLFLQFLYQKLLTFQSPAWSQFFLVWYHPILRIKINFFLLHANLKTVHIPPLHKLTKTVPACLSHPLDYEHLHFNHLRISQPSISLGTLKTSLEMLNEYILKVTNSIKNYIRSTTSDCTT